jgi:hypothetical protein
MNKFRGTNKYGAMLTVVVIVLYCIAEFLLPWLRNRKLKHPCKAYFHIREMRVGELDYILQDDKAHKVKELVLLFNSLVDIEIAYNPIVDFRVEETVFGFIGDADSKPVIEEAIAPFVAKGEIAMPPAYWDRNDNYHYPSRSMGRAIGSCYTKGFKVQTQQAGVYKVYLGFMTDERDGEDTSMRIRVEDKPSMKMRCKEHWGCWISPQNKSGHA